MHYACQFLIHQSCVVLFYLIFQSKTFRGTTNFNESQRSFLNEQDFEASKCENFLRCIRNCLKYFQNERRYVNRLLVNQKKQTDFVLIRIYDPVLRFLKNESDVSHNLKLTQHWLASRFIMRISSSLPWSSREKIFSFACVLLSYRFPSKREFIKTSSK